MKHQITKEDLVRNLYDESTFLEKMAIQKAKKNDSQMEKDYKSLKKAQDLRTDSHLIFPSPLSNRPLSSNALLHALQKRLKIDATIHGMRSAFKDWVAETTNYPNEVSEMALAHSISNQTEAAYRRGELLGKRRSMMQDWSDFVQGTEEKVLTLVREQA